jgi:hypothetical protein
LEAVMAEQFNAITITAEPAMSDCAMAIAAIN